MSHSLQKYPRLLKNNLDDSWKMLMHHRKKTKIQKLLALFILRHRSDENHVFDVKADDTLVDLLIASSPIPFTSSKNIFFQFLARCSENSKTFKKLPLKADAPDE